MLYASVMSGIRLSFLVLAAVALQMGCGGTSTSRSDWEVVADKKFASPCEAFESVAKFSLEAHVVRSAEEFPGLRKELASQIAREAGLEKPSAGPEKCADLEELRPRLKVDGEMLDTADLYRMALQFFVEGLDPHSRYLPPKAAEKYQKREKNQESGFGVEWQYQLADRWLPQSHLTVEAVFRDGPATGRLEGGDMIMAINGQSIEGSTILTALSLLGEEESARLKIKDKGEIEIRSAEYFSPPVLVSRETHGSYRAAYIRLRGFTEDSSAAVAKAIEDMRDVEGLVLDLRRNSGGRLEEAAKIADLFVASGLVAVTRGHAGKKLASRRLNLNSEYRARKEGGETDLPLVVLIDPGSASAAEILAGTLGSSGRALVAGDRSFGKGTGQTPFIVSERNGLGGMLFITTFRYYLFDSSTPQIEGVTPHEWAVDTRLRPAVARERASGKPVILFEGDYGPTVVPYTQNAVRYAPNGVLAAAIAEIRARRGEGAFEKTCGSAEDCPKALALAYLDAAASVERTWKPPKLEAGFSR